MYRQLAMPISSHKGNFGFKAEFWGGALDGISGSLGFPMHRRTTLMYVTLLGALLGVTRGSLQQILGAWNFALSFRREALCCLDVAFLCARKLPTRRHTPAHGALLDDLLVVAGIAPLLQADLRTQPRYDLFATDASPSGAGACIAKVTPDLWHSLHRIAEERGEHVRLDWGPGPPPPSFVSTHSSAAALVTPATWTELFAYRFRANDHINVLELVALVSLLRRLSNQGVRRQRILCCVDSRVVLGAATKGRSSSRKLNHVLRKLAYECLASSLTVDLLWVPSWANPADAPSRHFSLWTVGAVTSQFGLCSPRASCTSPPLLFVSSSCFRNRSLLVPLPCLARVLRHRQAALTPEVQSAIQKLLPPALNTRIFASGADVEHHAVTDIDPVQSFNANKVNLQSGNEAYDEDDKGGGGVMGEAGAAQCEQMCFLLFSRILSSVMSALLQIRSSELQVQRKVLSIFCGNAGACSLSFNSALYRIAGRSSDRRRLQQLLDAGDIEPHPGPPRKRPAPSQDLLQADILPSSRQCSARV